MMNLKDRKLTRNVDSKKHYFVKYRSYAFDLKIMNKYKGKFDQLIIRTTYGKKYVIDHDEFFNKAELNSQYGKDQLLIKVKYLKLEKNQHTKTIKLDEQTHKKLKEKAKQLNCRIVDLINKEIA